MADYIMYHEGNRRPGCLRQPEHLAESPFLIREEFQSGLRAKNIVAAGAETAGPAHLHQPLREGQDAGTKRACDKCGARRCL